MKPLDSTAAVPAVPQCIILDAVYPVRSLMEVMGWGDRQWQIAKDRGLRVLCCGRYSYIYGRDLLAFLEQQPAIDRGGGDGRPDLARRHRETKMPGGEPGKNGKD